ncbi:MAG TPA: flagellar hook-basal body complex protein FliE [Spirochaetia bacterium]|nr:flagellar hook-basal body complex protein FliE [Spirochaetia bacterium]
MNVLSSEVVKGQYVTLARTNPLHIRGTVNPEEADPASPASFEQALLKAFNGANDLVQNSTDLMQEFIVHPENVDAHDVTIAMANANTAVSITKAVVDGALKAYREIINVR